MDVGEPQFEFVRRSAWPDRETSALRREKSTHALERVRTRESVSNTTYPPRERKWHAEEVSEEDAEGPTPPYIFRRRLSAKENVLHDLLQWRNNVLSAQKQTVESVAEGPSRGRQRQRPSLLDALNDHSPSTPSLSRSSSPSGESAHTVHDDRRAIPGAYPSPSPSRSPANRQAIITPKLPLALQTSSSTSTQATVTSPWWHTDEEDIEDDEDYESESGWDTASITTSGSAVASPALPTAANSFERKHTHGRNENGGHGDPRGQFEVGSVMFYCQAIFLSLCPFFRERTNNCSISTRRIDCHTSH